MTAGKDVRVLDRKEESARRVARFANENVYSDGILNANVNSNTLLSSLPLIRIFAVYRTHTDGLDDEMSNSGFRPKAAWLAFDAGCGLWFVWALKSTSCKSDCQVLA